MMSDGKWQYVKAKFECIACGPSAYDSAYKEGYAKALEDLLGKAKASAYVFKVMYTGGLQNSTIVKEETKEVPIVSILELEKIIEELKK